MGKSKLRRGSHAPGFLREILGAAIENSASSRCNATPDAWVETLDDALGESCIYGCHLPHWQSLTKIQRAFWLTSNLWHCADIMPSMLCGELELPCGSTYARAARKLRPTIPKIAKK
jgi:hypothetical protein